jgi:hypothetical protein
MWYSDICMRLEHKQLNKITKELFLTIATCY